MKSMETQSFKDLPLSMEVLKSIEELWFENLFAVQVAEHIHLFAKYAKLKVLPVYGGESIGRQIRELQNGAQIVVGTPGRVIDLIERRMLNLSSVKVLVLDEADRMLDMGFIEDIEYILSKVPQSRQTCLFSATIDN